MTIPTKPPLPRWHDLAVQAKVDDLPASLPLRALTTWFEAAGSLGVIAAALAIGTIVFRASALATVGDLRQAIFLLVVGSAASFGTAHALERRKQIGALYALLLLLAPAGAWFWGGSLRAVVVLPMLVGLGLLAASWRELRR